MPAPSISHPRRVLGRTLIYTPAGTSIEVVLTCPADTTLRLRTVYLANQVNAARSFSIGIRKSGSATNHFLLVGKPVSSITTSNVTQLADVLYLEEGDALVFQRQNAAGVVNSDFRLFVCYEEIT